MPLSPDFDGILTASGVPAKFKVWLVDNGVLGRKGFILAARSDKAYVDQELIQTCRLALTLPVTIVIRKAWGVAEAVEQRERAATAAVMNKPEMPQFRNMKRKTSMASSSRNTRSNSRRDGSSRTTSRVGCYATGPPCQNG